MTNEADVDMLAEAREAQWTSLAFMGPDAIKLVAPAKANLFFDVRDPRGDGYHTVLNVMHSLALHDVIYMNWTPGSDGLEISIETVVKDTGSTKDGDVDPHFPIDDVANDPDANLAAKAVSALADRVGDDVDANGLMEIRIEKHIPAQAGLGGGSSDAAAALVGAAHLWGIEEKGALVREIASTLGADVAFFMDGGCRMLDGIGEHTVKALETMNSPVVIAKPVQGVPTAPAYREFDEDPVEIPASIVEAAMDADRAADVPLCNNLTKAAASIVPEIVAIIEALSSEDGVERAEDGSGDPKVLLCGSGSAVFAVCDSYSDALRITTEMQQHGWWSRATTFSRIPAARVG